MLRYSFGLNDAAAAIEGAVAKVISSGYRTGDILSPSDSTQNEWDIRHGGEGSRRRLRLASNPLNESRHALRGDFDLIESRCEATAQIAFAAWAESTSRNARHLFFLQ